MKICSFLLKLAQCREGNSAIEFGLMSPFLLVGLVMMVDIGLAVESRMEIDRNVRAGVQAAMANVNDVDAIRTVVLNSSETPDVMTVSVDQTCACGGSASSCTAWCATDEPPSVFVNISATKPFTGFMIPTFTLESQTHVQLR